MNYLASNRVYKQGLILILSTVHRVLNRHSSFIQHYYLKSKNLGLIQQLINKFILINYLAKIKMVNYTEGSNQ